MYVQCDIEFSGWFDFRPDTIYKYVIVLTPWYKKKLIKTLIEKSDPLWELANGKLKILTAKLNAYSADKEFCFSKHTLQQQFRKFIT